MIDFFRAGGFSMFLILFTALGAGALAGLRRQSATTILGRSATLLVIEGLFGLATNLTAVSNQYARFPDHLAAIGQGLGESATAGIFAGALATLLWAASIATGMRSPTPAGA